MFSERSETSIKMLDKHATKLLPEEKKQYQERCVNNVFVLTVFSRTIMENKYL